MVSGSDWAWSEQASRYCARPVVGLLADRRMEVFGRKGELADHLQAGAEIGVDRGVVAVDLQVFAVGRDRLVVFACKLAQEAELKMNLGNIGTEFRRLFKVRERRRHVLAVTMHQSPVVVGVERGGVRVDRLVERLERRVVILARPAADRDVDPPGNPLGIERHGGLVRGNGLVEVIVGLMHHTHGVVEFGAVRPRGERVGAQFAGLEEPAFAHVLVDRADRRLHGLRIVGAELIDVETLLTLKLRLAPAVYPVHSSKLLTMSVGTAGLYRGFAAALETI